jgi:hypothetical protein
VPDGSSQGGAQLPVKSIGGLAADLDPPRMRALELA